MRELSTTLDKAGATASMICAVHCVAVPLLLALIPVIGLTWLDNPWVDRSFLFLAFIFVILAHPRGYAQHRRCVPAFVALMGLIAIFLAILMWEGVGAHHYLVAAGGLMVAGSHWLNRHFCHRACCEHHH